ncbi:MAG: hypothetical protein HKN03_10815 [Acidimicrobiales bacterium]|nr:hypothetical protein [Acidimicrobiales bacterium]
MRVRALPPPLFSLLVAVSFVATGCSGFLGAGTERADLIQTLELQAGLDSADATCVADALFDDSGLTPDQIRDFTQGEYDQDNERYQEYLTYQEAVDAAVNDCIG